MIENILTVLKNDKIVMRKEVKADFKTVLLDCNVETSKHWCLCNSFANYLNTATKSCYKTFTPPDNGHTLGKVIYDDKKIQYCWSGNVVIT